MNFQLVSPYRPKGDQPQAIAQLAKGLRDGKKHQVLQGVTGSGKTFTMASLIQAAQRPTLVLSHNKTLADQLYREFKGFFPHNAVQLFISDYTFFQPQVYTPRRDSYIDKRAALDEKLTRHRIAAAISAISRPDVIVVCSVSCLFDIGSPQVCRDLAVPLVVGETVNQEGIIAWLARIGYRPTDTAVVPKAFRVFGHGIEVFPLYENCAYRIEFQDGCVKHILMIDPQTGDPVREHDRISIYPARLHMLPEGWIAVAVTEIKEELASRLQQLTRQGKLLEAQRLEAATSLDIKMLLENGYCPGIEVYCRVLNRRLPGAPPDTLLDYFPEDLLVFVDESHVTVPQIRAMHTGSRNRMKCLIDHGFRLPSAMDFRPLTFQEWEQRVGQVVFVSATPGPYELEKVGNAVVEQAIRPTGLLDPIIEVMPSENQMNYLLGEIRERAAVGERILVTTLTKRHAEEVTDYLSKQDVRCKWLHDELGTRERVKVLGDLRKGKFDVLVGVNLLREGIDLPEVSLVAILDADKAGFLRSETSLIQIIGRAARNVNAKVILFANTVTGAMTRAIVKTRNRRQMQAAYNQDHGITPKTICSRNLEVATGVAH